MAFQELSFHTGPTASESVYRDVSGGGLLLSSPHEVPLGTLLKLELRVPGLGKHQPKLGPTIETGPRPVVAVGEVVRLEALDSGQFELGIKFKNVYPDDWAALLKFIEASNSADTNMAD